MKDFDEYILEIVLKNIDNEKIRFKEIDTKAIGIITIVGILALFLSKPENIGRLSATLFLLTSISLLITILFCALAIGVRSYRILSTKLLIEDFANESSECQIGGVIGTSAEVERSLSDACNQKAKDLQYAVFALGASIVLLIFYSLFTSF